MTRFSALACIAMSKNTSLLSNELFDFVNLSIIALLISNIDQILCLFDRHVSFHWETFIANVNEVYEQLKSQS